MFPRTTQSPSMFLIMVIYLGLHTRRLFDDYHISSHDHLIYTSHEGIVRYDFYRLNNVCSPFQ